MTGKIACLVIALCAAGCGNQARRCESAPGDPAAGGELALCGGGPDAGTECVSGSDHCERGRQCASGLACAEVLSRDPCFTAELDEGCRCRPVALQRLAAGSRRLALQRGFSVAGMSSTVETAEVPPRITWRAPAGARLVACALFSCAPSFSFKDCSPTDEVALFEIDNFEPCVLLFGAFPATQPGFLLGHEHAYEGASSCASPEAAPEAGPRVVTELAAGCWAYDTTSIVAATELHPIRGSLLAGLPGLPEGGACTMDGAACYDASADVFGVCLEGACRPRCRSRVDCSLADPTPATGGACGWTCRDLPGHELGACVPAT